MDVIEVLGAARRYVDNLQPLSAVISPQGKPTKFGILSDFEADSGWSVGTPDAVNCRYGTQGLKVTAEGSVITTEKSLNLNMLGKSLFFDFYVDDITKLKEIQVALQVNNSWATSFSTSTTADNPYNRGIHQGWNTLACGPGEFTPIGSVVAGDFSRITSIRLRVVPITGETASVTFDRLLLVENPLTRAKVVITFDDGNESLMLAHAMMSRFGYRGTAYVVTSLLQGSPQISIDQAKMLRDCGWDISSHTHTHAYANQVDLATWRRELEQSKEILVANGFGAGANHFAYPGGHNSPEYRLEVSRYYQTARINIAYPYWCVMPEPNPWAIRTIPVIATSSLSGIMARIDRMAHHKQWGTLMFHRIIANATGSDITPEVFQDILEHLAESDVDVVTMSEMVAAPATTLAPQSPMLFDRTTGQPYVLAVDNGVLSVEAIG